MPSNTIQIVRLTYGHYVVTAIDIAGRTIAVAGSPRYSTETRRRQWAQEQAAQWSEKHYIPIDERIYS